MRRARHGGGYRGVDDGPDTHGLLVRQQLRLGSLELGLGQQSV